MASKLNTTGFYLSYFKCIVSVVASSQFPFYKVQHSRQLSAVFVELLFFLPYGFISCEGSCCLEFGLPTLLIIQAWLMLLLLLVIIDVSAITNFRNTG